MKLSFTTYRIFLKHPFGISRSSNNWYDIVFLFLQDGNIIGRGEAAPSIRYKESTEKILSVLNRGIKIPDSENINLEKMQNLIYPQLENIKSLRQLLAWLCGIGGLRKNKYHYGKFRM